MKTPDFIVGRFDAAAKIAIGFAVVFVCAPFGMMLLADLLTPDASGALSVQVGSFLPLLHGLLVGLSVMFVWVLVPVWTILATVSVLLAGVRKARPSRASILVVACASLMVGAFWAPAPLVQWPISILGEHEPHQLIRDLFPFHLVQPEWIGSGAVDGALTFRWQLEETVARYGVVALSWAFGLILIHRFGRPALPVARAPRRRVFVFDLSTKALLAAALFAAVTFASVWYRSTRLMASGEELLDRMKHRVRDEIVGKYHLEAANPPAAARASVARDFPTLTLDEQSTILAELWPKVRCPEFIGVLLPLAKLPEKTESHEKRELESLALVGLLDLQPDTARPLILDDLHRAKPLLSLTALCALPDQELPDLDGVFLEHLNPPADVFKIAPLIERYGSARIQAQVIAFYLAKEGKWACTIQAALLRYWLKHDRAAGLLAIGRAMNLRQDTGCYATLLGDTFGNFFTPDAEAITLPFIDDPERRVATDALTLLARSGSPTAKETVIKWLERVLPSESEEDWPREARFETLRALGHATDWKPTPNQRRRLAAALSVAEKSQFPKLVSPSESP